MKVIDVLLSALSVNQADIWLIFVQGLNVWLELKITLILDCLSFILASTLLVFLGTYCIFRTEK